MEPLVVRSETDPLTGLDAYDAADLLQLGNEQFSAEAYARAVTLFERLVADFPGSEHVPAALYNGGLAFEKMGKWGEAARSFSAVVDAHPESSSHKDAFFRLAFSYSKQGRWQDVLRTFRGVREAYQLGPLEELETRNGIGVALFMNEEYAEAESEFRRSISFYESLSEDQYVPAEYFVGQSRYYLGEIYARLFEQRGFTQPLENEDQWVEKIGDELEEKCRLLLRAQTNLIRAIRVGHGGWATAAGYRIGSLYETLYDQLLEVPVPASLSDEARKAYTEELRKRVAVLIVKAIKVYEMSVEMAERVGEKNEWVQRANASLDRMKQLYETQLLDG